MSGWTPAELDRVHAADELRLESRRPDGTLRPAVTIWAVRLGHDVYVRSAHGPENGWFRRAVAAGTGRVAVGGIEKDVRFVVPDDDVHDALDAAYHAAYDRYGPGIVGSVVGPVPAGATLRLDPLG